MTRAIRAVLVDDEPPARARLRQLLDAAGGVTVVGEADNAVDAQQVVRDTRPELLFLDIEMPEMLGTTLAALLPEPRPFIVFATAYEQYALEAFSHDATDYLLKSVTRTTLARTLDRVRQRLEGQSDLERDVATATALQAGMWAGTGFSVPHFDCAASSLPAHGVGGDFHDAFALSVSTWALLLGDVSGKGVPAALVASAIHGRIHTRLVTRGSRRMRSPRRLIATCWNRCADCATPRSSTPHSTPQPARWRSSMPGIRRVVSTCPETPRPPCSSRAARRSDSCPTARTW